MDVSKLPKLSQTPRPPENQDPDTRGSQRASPDYACDAVSIGGEAWISILIGAVILFMQQRFILWLVGRGAPWTDGQGNTIAYTQTLYFLHDLGLFAFG